MRTLFRPANRLATLFLLLSYILLTAVPFIPVLLGHPLDHPWQMLSFELLAWLAVWGIFKRPAYFHWLLVPAFLAVPTEIYLFIFYGQGISTHHLGIIMETSPMEAMEFLGQKVWLMGAIMLAVIVWCALGWWAATRTRELDWTGKTRPSALGLLLLLGAFWLYGHEFGFAAKLRHHAPHATASASAGSEEAEDEDNAEDASIAGADETGLAWPSLPHWAQLPYELNMVNNSWPFGLIGRGYDFYKERRYLAELGKKSSNFRFGARQQSPDTQPEVVVMVIGESSRYDRWSLNGYTRDTNPLLKQESNLVPLADVITSVSATRLSVPVIVSRKPATQSLKDGFSEKSFITAYKEAGFKTYWLSNQISFGKFDTPVSVFAKEADVVQFLNLGGFTNTSNFDQILFDPLKNALADPAPKKLIVLHTLGSHWNYSERYPKSFDKWQPSLFGVDKPVYTDTAIKPQLNNSYDSSILYTDWFLSNVIGILKDGGERTALRSSLVYVADHGQTLYDGTCRLAFHGHNTQYEFHVPSFVWYSPQFQLRYPDKVTQLHLHQKSRLSTENMFHTVLDMGDIHFPGEQPEWSFVNPRFKQHKRYVDSYGWTNYDNSTLRGDCHEVIDRGTPEKQEK
ncbi:MULTISPECIES: phosphoethanolamine transferase [unclassified Janthinobacterium]|uniref:phosphoethanolamine transferase n=1 Tax=unclassified Janthinobacterium TaxID=2610881 RepID=UPI00160F8A37|nr:MULTISPECIES: phosphoethanolamine transferase [unclassified Janthinobacterium]MBB5605825.1 glucan phosphoethanolaminetransferase (alkaline phosphatase superfamily) [Janthinobacterium sp. S3T4]MBB5611256.1 glucan phosphoethanolaminetransferase (alkaline phosphatase superfamily) [Janthinobacterium sp. S3M3]